MCNCRLRKVQDTLVLFLPRPQNRAGKCLCNLRTLKPRRVNIPSSFLTLDAFIVPQLVLSSQIEFISFLYNDFYGKKCSNRPVIQENTYNSSSSSTSLHLTVPIAIWIQFGPFWSIVTRSIFPRTSFLAIYQFPITSRFSIQQSQRTLEPTKANSSTTEQNTEARSEI